MTDERTATVARPAGLAAEIRGAVTPRAVLLVVGVLLLQLGFIFSYIAAFHQPTPHRIPMAVVAPDGAPAGTAQQTVDQLNAISGHPVSARTVADADTARKQIRDRTLNGALLLGESGSDQLLVASAGGAALSQALEEAMTAATASQQRQLKVTDLVPTGSGDARGLASFYLAIGWVVGGYLVASILTISVGALPANGRRAVIRLVSLALYAVVSGIAGAVIAGPMLGALTGHFWQVAGLGALVVLGVGAFTMALQALTGIVGIGIAVFLFVILGNPSAGGPYPAPLLPPFWRDIGPFLPPGAGTSGLRSIVYFNGSGALQPLLVAGAYAVVSIVVLVIVATRRSRPAPASSP